MCLGKASFSQIHKQSKDTYTRNITMSKAEIPKPMARLAYVVMTLTIGAHKPHRVMMIKGA